MSYTSKYTGSEIDNLLDRIGGGAKIVELANINDFAENFTNKSITLSDSIENYDYIEIEFCARTNENERNFPTKWYNVKTIIESGYGSATRYFVHEEYLVAGGPYQITGSFHILNATTIVLEGVMKEGFDECGIDKIYGIKLNTANGTASTNNPIGSIVPIMGTQAPKDHLVCDGSELNISEYKELADYFEIQFGSKNYFGGDGVTTFAIPDLRNEFLRGYHGDAELQLSGEIGEHQDATEHYATQISYSAKRLQFGNPNDWGATYKFGTEDTRIHGVDGYQGFNCSTGSKESYSTGDIGSYTSRPTNVAVLFCIKYTESGNTNGRSSYKETELLDSHKLFSIGGTQVYINQDIILTDDISNYDELVFRISRTNAVGQVAHVNEQTYRVKNIVYNNSDTNSWDGSVFNLNLHFGEVVSTLVWFKDKKTLRVWCTNAHFAVQSNESIEFISIKGIKY